MPSSVTKHSNKINSEINYLDEIISSKLWLWMVQYMKVNILVDFKLHRIKHSWLKDSSYGE